MSIYNYEAVDIQGNNRDLSEFKGKLLLIVNTASNCRFTPQYAGLEAIYKEYESAGLVVLGFPCNQFAYQERGVDSQIAEFCTKNYGVSFPMFSKIDVNGKNAHPLYQHLKKEAKGILGTQKIKWNFTKFLIDQNGNVVRRYSPSVKPSSIKLDIERYLKSD